MSQFTVDVCLFDLDGTIVNSIEAAECAWRKLCEQNDVDPIELFKYSHGVRTADVLAKFFPNIDDTDNKGVQLLEVSIAKEFSHLVTLIPGSKDILSLLDINSVNNTKFEDRRWAIVTSGSPFCVFSWFDNILKEVGKPEVFITSFDVTKGKPDPEGYSSAKEQLCQKWNFDSNTARSVVFEDAPAGIIAGKAMGAIVVGITSSYDKELLFEAGADFVVNDLTQLSVIKNTKNDGVTFQVNNPLKRAE